ncbi:MAG: hypothetical protein ACLVEU_16240, partial [Bacteroides cellulosilyticus]
LRLIRFCFFSTCSTSAKQVDVDGNGIAISFKGSIISVLGITNRAEINFFLYDGTYWMNGWFNGTV